jgi:hypothetical protein
MMMMMILMTYTGNVLKCTEDLAKDGEADDHDDVCNIFIHAHLRRNVKPLWCFVCPSFVNIKIREVIQMAD